MKYTIPRAPWSSVPPIEVEIDTIEGEAAGVVLGRAVVAARKAGADLRGAVLTDAVLTGADLRGAVLTGAVLTDAVLTGAKLPPAPTVDSIHQAVYAAASAPDALEMGAWHTCDTTHCRAGWAITLAGEAGRALEREIGPSAAGALIYMASDPTLERVPNWIASDADALDDMRRLAELEATR